MYLLGIRDFSIVRCCSYGIALLLKFDDLTDIDCCSTLLDITHCNIYFKALLSYEPAAARISSHHVCATLVALPLTVCTWRCNHGSVAAVPPCPAFAAALAAALAAAFSSFSLLFSARSCMESPRVPDGRQNTIQCPIPTNRCLQQVHATVDLCAQSAGHRTRSWQGHLLLGQLEGFPLSRLLPARSQGVRLRLPVVRALPLVRGDAGHVLSVNLCSWHVRTLDVAGSTV